MHYMVTTDGAYFAGHAVVNTDAARDHLVASGLWREVGYAEYRSCEVKMGTSRAGDIFLIRADGYHAAVRDAAWAKVLVDQGYYEVDQDDYQLFVLRHRGVGSGVKAPKAPLFDVDQLASDDRNQAVASRYGIDAPIGEEEVSDAVD